jgi:hypothetical protein
VTRIKHCTATDLHSCSRLFAGHSPHAAMAGVVHGLIDLLRGGLSEFSPHHHDAKTPTSQRPWKT